mgnify:CR=1 FL=1
MEKIRDLQTATGKYIKTKVADIQRLYSKWLWLLMAISKPSLSDAEFLKNIPQYFICSNFTAYNFGQMEKAFT